MEGRASFHDYWRAGIVRQDERRCVIGRIVAPPAFPVFIGPFGANRAEHVAAENEGAKTGISRRRVFRVDTFRLALFTEHRLECPGREKPLKQFRAALAEGREYYVLAYVSKNGAQDGKFRRISVETTNKTLNIRAKSGYWAAGAAQ